MSHHDSFPASRDRTLVPDRQRHGSIRVRLSSPLAVRVGFVPVPKFHCLCPVRDWRLTPSRLVSAVISALLFLALSDPALADVSTTWGSWAQIVAEGDLGFVDPSLKDARLWLEGQSRWNEDWQHWNQGMARAALGYSLSDRATIWLGYTFLPTQLQGRPYIAQQDLWPAFRYILPTEYGTFMFRTMFETNFIRGDDPRFRPRQMIRFMYPLELEPRLSLVAWDEFFVRINSARWGGQAGFDQNRVFLGLGWTFTPGVRAELGYLNQYVENATQTNETDTNLIMGSLFVNW